MNIISDINLTAPILFALDKIKNRDVRILLKKDAGIPEQGYRRLVAGDEVTFCVSDEAGAMYALLDLNDAFEMQLPFEEQEVVPHLKNRGLKFNIPLDARTPSYSDASDSAVRNIPHMWEMSFWHAFLDRMAENRYNVLSLWSLSPFPSLVRIPEFPEACIDDVKVSTRRFRPMLSGDHIYDEDHRKHLVTVKRMTIEEKTAFFREVMEYARDRCIRVYLFTWNVFTFGTEHTQYGLTPDQNNPVTRAYYYHGVQALMDAYPLLAGIGVTAGENMSFNGENHDEVPFSRTDIGFIRETYGRAVEDYLQQHPGRVFTFIHRMMMARYDEIMNAFQDYQGDFEISFKYSQAHMYSHTRPPFIESFLAEKDPSVRFWLTVRNDDYYLYRWGDPEFAREYLANMPMDGLQGFYMGADGFTWGMDYATRGVNGSMLFIDKMWYMFSIWGKQAYNLHLPDGFFRRMLMHRLDLTQDQSHVLYQAWREASGIFQLFNCTHWHHYDFQWYPEGCCMYLNKGLEKIVFADIYEFMDCPALQNREYLSVREYAQNVYHGIASEKITPACVADQILQYAGNGLALSASDAFTDTGEECQRILSDIHGLSLLGMYYGLKLRAAISLSVYCLNREEQLKKDAIEDLKEAIDWYKRYSAKTNQVYLPQVLSRLCGLINVQSFDEDAQKDLMLAQEL